MAAIPKETTEVNSEARNARRDDASPSFSWNVR